MGDIYEGATITISAAVASSASEGFLRMPRPQLKPFEVTLPLVRAGKGNLKVQLLAETRCIWDGRVDDLPLWSRGWALQEFYLSRRILIYTREQVLWYCNTRHLSGPHVALSCPIMTLHNQEPVLEEEPPRWDAEGEQGDGEKEAAAQMKFQREGWCRLVHDYTGRSLTDANDRGHALQGIVQKLRKLWKTRYKFGVWEDAWPSDLTLVRVEGGRKPALPAKNLSLAPSWSWLAIDSIVACMGYMEDSVYDVRSVVDSQSDTAPSSNCEKDDPENDKFHSWPSNALRFRGRLISFQEFGSRRLNEFRSRRPDDNFVPLIDGTIWDRVWTVVLDDAEAMSSEPDLLEREAGTEKELFFDTY